MEFERLDDVEEQRGPDLDWDDVYTVKLKVQIDELVLSKVCKVISIFPICLYDPIELLDHTCEFRLKNTLGHFVSDSEYETLDSLCRVKDGCVSQVVSLSLTDVDIVHEKIDVNGLSPIYG